MMKKSSHNSDKNLILDIISNYEKLESHINTLSDFKAIGREKKALFKLETVYLMAKNYIKIEDEIQWVMDLPPEDQVAFLPEIDQMKNNMESIVASIKVEIINQQEGHLDQNIYLEIRAGTGGDEASLFAGELLSMYEKYSAKNNLTMDILEHSYNDAGGIKSITTLIKGAWAWKYFQFESGGHRVQRVPVTEKNGRIHTSTVTVAILPEEDEQDDNFNMKDVKIEYSTAQGAGGQHVNKTESAVIMVHLPTGLKVKIQDERSQHKNKDKAISVLKMRVREHYIALKQEETSEHRLNQVGTGERNEKIRTYNFPQNRLTHHCFNITLYNLSELMSGEITQLFNLMLLAARWEKQHDNTEN